MAVSDNLISVGTVLSVACIIFSVYMRDYNELDTRLVNVINGLISVEGQQVKLSPKVAVGYGACVDLSIEGKYLLSPGDHLRPTHHDTIDSYNQLLESYAYYFKHGAATERFTFNSSLFDELVLAAERVPGSRYVVGGNAALMAVRMHLEGCRVLLAATLTEKHMESIPEGITVVGGPIKRDDIHLVMEYKAGEDWGPFTAPRANRFILHNDFHNPRVKSMEAFGRQLDAFRPDVFVISGLQLMDNYRYSENKDLKEDLVQRIKEQIHAVPRSTRIHFEMASYTEEKLLNLVKEHIVPYSNSLGMNEQELANLHSLYKFGNVSVVTDSTPRVAAVLDEMRSIFWEIRRTNKAISGHKTLSRIHVHTLAFQAIVVDSVATWKQPDVAAAKASLTAYRHACASAEVDANLAKLLMDDGFARSAVVMEAGRVILEPEKPVSCWQEDQLTICVAMGLVCKNAQQTAGGGDNISAAALAVQI